MLMLEHTPWACHSPFPEPLPLIFRIVRVLWSLNLTPQVSKCMPAVAHTHGVLTALCTLACMLVLQGLIRYLGPFGPPAIRFLVSARYTGANPDLNLEGTK